MDPKIEKAHKKLFTAALYVLELAEQEPNGDYIVNEDNFEMLAKAYESVYEALKAVAYGDHNPMPGAFSYTMDNEKVGVSPS